MQPDAWKARKGVREAEDIVIQHVGVPPCDDLVDPDGILWTGAIECDGRLLAVLPLLTGISADKPTGADGS